MGPLWTASGTVVGVNLGGFFWLTRRAIAEMATRYGGHVVNVSATLAEAANSGAPAVLAALTRSLAIEYASRSIRVNAVSPGIIQTPVHPAESYQGLGGRLPVGCLNAFMQLRATTEKRPKPDACA